MKEVLKGLTENQASTDPRAEDRRLRGRTYAIPFEDVWQASVGLCGGGIRGWSILSTDDQRGVIEAVSTTLVRRREDDVRVEIGLDENAQTRVDLWSSSQRGQKALGRNRRLISRFCSRLDRTLKAKPDQILDATAGSEWFEG